MQPAALDTLRLVRTDLHEGEHGDWWRVEFDGAGAKTGELVGFVQFVREAREVGFGILAPYRGRGFAHRALALLIDELAPASGRLEFVAFTRRDNAAAQAVLRTNGFRLADGPRGDADPSWLRLARSVEPHESAPGPD